VKNLVLGWLLLCVGTACFAQDQAPLYPRHIETPNYPAIARAAHISGKITLKVTIGADGNVEHVEATAENPVQREHPLLQKYAIENMQHWTFAKPPSAPYTQIIVYDYELDPELPDGGGKTTFDLPDHVLITTNVPTIEVQSSRARN
jgi:TonB family protein